MRIRGWTRNQNPAWIQVPSPYPAKDGRIRIPVFSLSLIFLLFDAFKSTKQIKKQFGLAMSNQRSFKIESFPFPAFVPKKIEYIRF
jgi:hypothetical protein